MGNEAFGAWLRAGREAAGLSQIAAAAAGGIHHSYLSKIERGRDISGVGVPAEGTIRKLATAVALDPDDAVERAGLIAEDFAADLRALPPGRQRALRLQAAAAASAHRRAAPPHADEARRCWDEALAGVRRDPVEAGMTHPAEDRLLAAILCDHRATRERLLALVGRPGAAGLLWLAGRLDAGVAREICRPAAWAACCSGDIEERDAGIRALEGWGDPADAALLRYRAAVEPHRWLREYATRAAEDLAGKGG